MSRDEDPRAEGPHSVGGMSDARAAAANRSGAITVVACIGGSVFLEALQAVSDATDDVRIVAADLQLSVALDLVELLKPRVAVIDASQVERAGEPGRRRLQRAAGGTRILFHGLPEAEQMIGYVVDCGIVGALSRTAEVEHCVKAIRAVAAGEFWLSRDLTARLLNRILGEHRGDDVTAVDEKPALTQRESQIVRLLKDGLTDKEVGQTLGISPTTVKTHVGKVFDKMGIWRRAQL